MGLDNTENDVNISSQTDPTPDSGAAGSADSQPAPNSADSGASAGTSGATAVASQPDEGPTGSLTSGEKQQPTAQPSIDIEKRLRDNQAAYQREHQERLRLQQEHEKLRRQVEQFRDIDARELDDFRRSKQAQVPMWHRKHPEHEKFKRYLQTAEIIQQQLAGIEDPNEKAIAQKYALRALPEEAQRVLQEYREHTTSRQREMFTDPDGFLEEKFDKFFQERISKWHQGTAQEFQEATMASKEVNDWFEKNQHMWRGQEQQIAQRLQRGEDWNIIQRDVELAYYRKTFSSADTAKKSAEEKERLLRGNAAAAVAHDPKSTGKVDPIALFKQQGGDINDRSAYNSFIFELAKQGSI